LKIKCGAASSPTRAAQKRKELKEENNNNNIITPLRSPYGATLVVTGPPVVGNATSVVRYAYRSNCFAPPQRFVRSVEVATAPLDVCTLVLP
jgi:hypothetical protein